MTGGSHSKYAAGRILPLLTCRPIFGGNAGGSGGTSDTPAGYMTHVYAYLGTALQYQLKRVSITAAYNHGVTGGQEFLLEP